MCDRPIDKQLILGRIELDDKEPRTSEIPDGSSCWHVPDGHGPPTFGWSFWLGVVDGKEKGKR